MEKGNIINQMSEYDFNAPINVTMIFDDNDDDIIEEQYVINLEGHSSNEVKNIAVKEELLDVTEDHVYEAHEFVVHEDTNKNLQNEEEVNITKESRKRYSQERNILNPELKKIRSKQNSSYCKENKNSCNLTHDTYQIAQSIDNKFTDERLEINKNYPEESNSHVPIMLNTLCDNLLVIIDSYHVMRRCRLSDEITQRKSQKAFLFIRNYFFNRSFYILETIVLPQESINLKEKIINNTIYFAKVNKSIQIHRHHVEPLYDLMIKWAKAKMIYIKTSQMQQATHSNPILVQHLNQPIRLNHMPSAYARSNRNHDPANDNTCIFSSGLPGKEVTISVNADTVRNLASKENYTRKTVPPRINMDPLDVQYNQDKSASPNHTEITNIFNVLQSVAPEQQAHIMRKIHSRTNYMPSRGFPLPYSIPTPRDHTNSIHNNYLQQLVNSVATQNIINTTRSSVSTESGYETPPYSSCLTPSVGAKECPVVTPMISSVVSLNPNALSTSGSCQLCGVVTQSRCYKCFSHYYCSPVCQQLDWQSHKGVCREIYLNYPN